jgi:hypothetical protein
VNTNFKIGVTVPTQKSKLTLYSPVPYQIKALGRLEGGWQDWAGDMWISFEMDQDGQTISNLTGSVDQAGLIGLLRRLYSLGLPIISVVYIED